ncbi:MAG: cupin domain-containing protein [Halobacteriales archaeon]|nr:cupin domain-containing protein [Halobacteriales archaeon]
MDLTAVSTRLEELSADELYDEFIREESLSVGLYRRPAGGTDPQEPHTEDEVYYVVSGRARIEVNGDSSPVAPGDVVFVEREADHRFHDIEEELVLLVFFAPAEGTLAE